MINHLENYSGAQIVRFNVLCLLYCEVSVVCAESPGPSNCKQTFRKVVLSEVREAVVAW